MKNLIKSLAIAAMLSAAACAPALAAKTTISFGTGGPTGNYFWMANDINEFCGAELPSGKTLDIINTGGSIDNVDGMVSKKYKVGWIQEDVLQFYAKNNPKKVNEKRMKVIIAGHDEILHLLVPKGYTPSSGNKNMWSSFASAAGFGSDPEKAIDLNSMKGQVIGAWGGSLVSANALNHFANLGMKIREIGPNEKTAPKIPVLIVGGHPYAPVQDLLNTGKYTMLPIVSPSLVERVSFYNETVASYNVNGKLVNIPTLSVRALLMAKASRKAERNADMVYLSNCIKDSLIDLVDEEETNPNWETIFEAVDGDEDGDNMADWKYFVN